MQENSSLQLNKVLQVGKFSLSAPGGVESVSRQIHMLCESVDVTSLTFLARSGSAPLTKEVAVPAWFTYRGQPVSLVYVIELVKLMGKFKTVLVHFPNIISLLTMCFFLRSHKIIVFWHADILNKGILGKFIRVFERWVCKHAYKVIYTTDAYYQESYSKAWVAEHQREIVPLGVLSPCVSKKNLSGPSQRLNILYLGRHADYKGLNALFTAVERVPCVHLTVAGVDESTLSLLAPSCDRIKGRGLVTTEDKEQLIAESDFLILPSVTKAEAFGIVLIEALAAGTPVIVRRVTGSGMNEVVAPFLGRPVGLIVDCEQNMTLEQVLQDAFNISSAAYEAMSLAARAKYERMYTQQSFVSAMSLVLT